LSGGLSHRMLRATYQTGIVIVTNFAIRQATVVPLAAMIVPMLVGLALPRYSSVSQQMSELEMYAPAADITTRIAAIVSGTSIVLFGMGLLRIGFRQFVFTALAAIVFGISMVSNGIFTMGGPLHGLYGIGIFCVVAPAFFAAEFRDSARSRTIGTLSMAIAVFSLLYNWMMIVHFDPAGFQGLTQRIFAIVAFGWYSIASYALLRSKVAEPTGEPQNVGAAYRAS